MLKKITILSRNSGLRALTAFLSPGRNYCAAKAEGNEQYSTINLQLYSFTHISEPKVESKTEKKDESPIPELLVTSEKTGNITLIGINRPDVRNCVNTETAMQLSQAIETYENDPESPVAILYGAGGNFCAGYDLKELVKNKETVSSLILRSEGAMVSLV